MAISAYILKIVENDPFLRLQMRAKEMFNSISGEAHPFWLHIPDMTQNGSAPREGKWAKMVTKVKAARVKELRG